MRFHLRWGSCARSLRFVLATLSLCCFGAESQAANIRWSAGNGTFHTPANWQGGLIPGILDVAQFGRSVQFLPQTYTVSFNNNATNQAIHIEDDNVTFDLNSRVYTVTAADGVLIGLPGNFAGRLTVTGGTLTSSTKIDVGAAANRVGFLTVGAGGLVSGAANLNVGNLATGTLMVQAGGDISLTGATNVGVGTGITGTATITGDGTIGSATLLTAGLNVGNAGTGTVNVQLGGLLQNSGAASIGSGDVFTGVGTGTVNVTNPGSVWNSQGLLKVGDAGNGEVNITLGGDGTGVDTIIGADVSNSGEMNVDGAGSSWDNSGTLTVGGLGTGTLNITEQGVVETESVIIGSANLPSSHGKVFVSGAGSQWLVANGLSIGAQGTGILNIMDGGTVVDGLGLMTSVGQEVGSEGAVTVDGVGSVWEHRLLSLGDGGQGTLNIANGGTVRTHDVSNVGLGENSSATIAVTGANSLWEISKGLFLGGNGTAAMNISSGGKVKSAEIGIGVGDGGVGHVVVDGVGSVWEYSANTTSPESIADFGVGGLGSGTLEITGGGQVVSTATSGSVINEIRAVDGRAGLVRVAGPGSLWNATGSGDGIIVVGKSSSGTLEITAGGVVQGDEMIVGLFDGESADGVVTVSGSGSLLDLSGLAQVGLSRASGRLNITAGGRVQTGGLRINGDSFAGVSDVAVDGAGSRLDVFSFLTVGNSSPPVSLNQANLTISGGGRVESTGPALVGTGDGGRATVTITGAGSAWVVGEQLLLGISTFESTGVGTVRVQSGATLVTADKTIVVRGLLSLEGGTLSTPEIDFLDGGEADHEFDWTSGTLHVFRFHGDLVNQAGVLAPGDLAEGGPIGLTIVFGDYNQLSAATLHIELAGIANHDSVQINDKAFLDGELSVSLIEGFTPTGADTMTILSASSDNLFGAFDNVASGQRLATTDGLGSFVVNYGAGSAFNPRQLVLSNFLAGGSLPGDFDLDGDVDGRDFLVWQRGDSPVSGSADDLSDWQTNFSMTTSLMVMTAVVPEPAAAALCLAALGFTLTSRLLEQHQRIEGGGATAAPLFFHDCQSWSIAPTTGTPGVT